MLMQKARGQVLQLSAGRGSLSNAKQHAHTGARTENDYLPAGCFLLIAVYAAEGTSVRLATKRETAWMVISSFSFCVFLLVTLLLGN